MAEFTAIMSKPDGKDVFNQFVNPRDEIGLHKLSLHAFKVVKPGFFLSADLTPRHNGTIWVEEQDDPVQRSAVMTFGWCYKIGSGKNQLEDSEMAELIASQRSNGMPNVEVLSGTYCLLSYDHVNESLWVCTDIWAQQGFYFGSNNAIVVASSKAAVVGNILNTKLDGITYLALVRGANIPPGRSLFANVWRATCGRAVHFDVGHNSARLVQIQPLYRPIEKMNFKSAVDRLIEAITHVIPLACSSSSTCVDLTGGQDTRMTASALSYAQGGKIGRQVTFRVTGSPDHPDVITSRKIASLMDWHLVRNDRNMPFDYTLDTIREAAILSDGKFLLPVVLHRLAEERSEAWDSTDGLVGSIAGELFRDYVWRHDLYKLGTTSKVNFDSFLTHKLHPRLHNIDEKDIKRVSGGQLNRAEHNEHLIQPYKALDKALPPVNCFYKLDRFYHFKLMHHPWCWNLSDIRKTITPYFSHEMTLASLSIPWYLRLGRMIVTTAIYKIAPQLASILTASGTPMEPLKLNNIQKYVNWLVSDARSIYKRHFGPKKFTQIGETVYTIDPLCLDLLLQGKTARNLYENHEIINQAVQYKDNHLSRSQYLELQSLLLVEMLIQEYPGISPSLSFSSDNVNITEPSFLL